MSKYGQNCSRREDCRSLLNSACHDQRGKCECEPGFRYELVLDSCMLEPRSYGQDCDSNKTCRRWDRNMACEPKLKVCVCGLGFTYDEKTELCQHKLTNPCPIGFKWNARVHDCEGRGRHRGSDKMVDVIIVFVFFVILLLVIRKWKPAHASHGLDRDLSWPLRSWSGRENPATVLFLSAARPSLWSSISGERNSDGIDRTRPQPAPQYEPSDLYDPPPTYDEAIRMCAHGKPDEDDPAIIRTTSPVAEPLNEESGNRAPSRARRESDDPFEV